MGLKSKDVRRALYNSTLFKIKLEKTIVDSHRSYSKGRSLTFTSIINFNGVHFAFELSLE